MLGSAAPALGELVLRLDATEASKITLSSDMTTGTIFGFPDAREVGLKYVEGWGQTYGATANPNLNPIFTPLRTSNFNPNLHRPTYDPDGLGTGKPSVNFDFINGDAVLGQGQRLAAGLDNLIDNDEYTIFFVGQRLDNRFQTAFGQDFNFRPSGWDFGPSSGNFELRAGGYDTTSSAAGVASADTSEGVVVHSVFSTAGGTIDYESRDTGGNLLVNSQPRSDFGIYSAGDFVLGNRGGWDTANSIPFNGRIGEIAVFDTQLSASQRDAVRVFLENKWVGGPAPSPAQLATAQGLLNQAAPTGTSQLLRYEFRKNLPADADATILIPDRVMTGLTASDINSGGGLAPPVPTPGAFSSSIVGVSAHSGYLGNSWSLNQVEQSPTGESPYYLGFTVTPSANKEIDASSLSFAIARGELDTNDLAKSLRSAQNGVDSFGVWVDNGGGFVKVGGQVQIGPPEGSSDLVAYFFDTVNVDLSSLGPLTQETEIRIYFWHDGAFISEPQEGDSHNARIDNVRFYGTVQDLGTGGVEGDYNGNGVVDAADYVIWRKTMGDPASYNTWRTNFGRSGGSGAGSTSVPEPSSLALLMLALVACLCHRRPANR